MSKKPKQVRSFRLSNKHDELLSISAYANKTSKTKVLEHCINRYYKLKTKQKMSNSINWGEIYTSSWWGNNNTNEPKTKQTMFKRKPKMKQMKVELNDALRNAIKLCKIKARLKANLKRVKR